ncbi:uncharacterized protein LOC112590664 [Harpegnathos saltator]|uniref:uncharacterized protein LOC112590664 n=1 Tax=Harpegnathos saltator TaxID=610380 RepID=UPI000DBEEC9E|nr:uncharacterized protein LOC112590664 [Harpegnathos saltator]
MFNYNICKISTGDFRIVPKNWLSKNKATFQWPSYKNVNEVNTAICNMCEPESDWDEISFDKMLMSKDDYSSAKDILQIIQIVSDAELSELDETKLKKSRSKRHKKIYQFTNDATTSNDESYNSAKSTKKVKKVSHNLPLKPAQFQSFLQYTTTTNKSLGFEILKRKQQLVIVLIVVLH